MGINETIFKTLEWICGWCNFTWFEVYLLVGYHYLIKVSFSSYLVIHCGVLLSLKV
jgi:hypothetical protein